MNINLSRPYQNFQPYCDSDHWNSPQVCFDSRQPHRWLMGVSQQDWCNKVVEYLQVLGSGPFKQRSIRVILFQRNPVDLLAGFMACAIAQCPVFLGNPNWTAPERDRAIAIAKPHIIWSDQESKSDPKQADDPTEAGWIMIPTGGTSGQMKFAIHTWSTLSAAVGGVQSFFFRDRPQPIHSCCVLPLYHVSGLMQFMRSLLTGGDFMILPFTSLLNGESSDPEIRQFLLPEAKSNPAFFLSLVPTQLSRLIEACQRQSPERFLWLRQFQVIFLGGAPASFSLLNQARHHQLKLAPCYGMTETAAQVMTLHPSEFLAGYNPPGQTLPHVRLDLMASSPQKKIGQMRWSGPSICLGYYPHPSPYPHRSPLRHFLSDDIAERLADGSLILKGRASRKILSGGENIYPEEIEAVLMAMTEIKDVCVFGFPDEDWGEIAIAAYVPSHRPLSQDYLRQTVKTSLASYKCPKIWWPCAEIPRNAQGKVQLMQLKDNWQFS